MNKKFFIVRECEDGVLLYRCCCDFGCLNPCPINNNRYHHSENKDKGTFDKISIDTFYHKWPTHSKIRGDITFELEN